MKTPSLFKRWSYSAWSLGKKCPYALKLAYIDKLRGPPVPAMERGTMLHLLAEQYLKGKITGMPPQLRKIENQLRALKREKPIVERFWNLDINWRPTRDGWAVAKLDACVAPTKAEPVADVIDHKSGREYENEHIKQASLYASFTDGMYPFVEEVNVAFFYIDQGISPSYKFTRAQLNYGKKYWIEQGKEHMAMKKFPATPTIDGCKWCGFRDDKKLANGEPGPCRAWRSARI